MTREEQVALYEENENLVPYVLKSMMADDKITEDLLQIGKLGLWKAVLAYDPSRGRFSTYAVISIKRALMENLRYWTVEKRMPPGNIPPMSLDLLSGYNGKEKDFSPLEYFHEASAPANVIWIGLPASEAFTKRMLDIMRLRVRGYMYKEIADILGVCELTVQKDTKAIKRIIRENTLSIY